MKNISSLCPEILQGLFKSARTSWKVLLFLLCLLSSHANGEEKPATSKEQQADSKKQAAIGKVISSQGKVKAVKPDKTERQLKRGDAFYSLETILVDIASKIQLKFLDGAIINLIESTEYRVDSYVFKDPKEKSGTLSTMAKGGFRAISGSIAKENPEGVKVKTPVATIGLRGTRDAAVLKDGELSVGCDEGKVAVINDIGEVECGPASPTLFSVVKENEAPMASVEIPEILATTSFEVEGGLPLEHESTEELPPEAEQPEEGAAAGEEEQPEEEEAPLSEDSDEETEAGAEEEEEPEVEEESEEEAEPETDEEAEAADESEEPEDLESEAGTEEEEQPEEEAAPGEEEAAPGEEEAAPGEEEAAPGEEEAAPGEEEAAPGEEEAAPGEEGAAGEEGTAGEEGAAGAGEEGAAAEPAEETSSSGIGPGGEGAAGGGGEEGE